MGEIAATTRVTEAVIEAAHAAVEEVAAVVVGKAGFEGALIEERFEEEAIEWEVDPIEEVDVGGAVEGRRGPEIGSLLTATSKIPRNSFFRASRR
jgi:hypothetical protein